MGLVYRNGRPYLYRSRRIGGRITTEYLGKGEDALLLYAILTLDREQADVERWQEREERRAMDDLEQALADEARQARQAAFELLEEAGFHRHKQGEWRKRRGTRTEKSPAD